jgi:hypothetical protein
LCDVITPEMQELYLLDSCAFVEDVIFNKDAKVYGGELEIAPDQRKVLEALGQGHKRISIRSGRSCGKSVLDTWIAWWFLCTRPRPQVVITAPTYKQVNDVLWTNMSKWKRISTIDSLFTFTKRRIYLNEEPNEWYATPITANKPEGIQGPHNVHLLLICDEASGILDEIYNTLQGSLSEEDNIVILSGNPTQTSGFFFDSHNRNRKRWKTFHFSSLNSPFATEDFVEDYRIRYGENHTLWKVHIVGDFPSGSPESYIPLEHVMAAVNRNVKPQGDIQIGVDPARFGDDLTTIAWRHGNKFYDVDSHAQTSIPDTIGLTIKKVKDIRESTRYKDTIRICVDEGGIGAGVADGLALDRENNIEVIPVNFGATGDERREYYCSVLWGDLRDNIGIVQLPEDEDMVTELSSRRFKVTPAGKERVEPKSEFKKEYGKSPDKADAIILANANAENRRRIIREFDHLDKNTVFDVFSKGYMLGGDKFCSIYQSKDRVFHILVCMWSSGKLVILGEYETDETPATLARVIHMNGPYIRISGNDQLFGEFKHDVSSQFRKYGISIYENYRYDEPGAIENLNLLVKAKALKVHDSCSKTISQLRKWSYDKNRKNLEIEFGLCYSLLNIISELKDKIQPISYQKPFPIYSLKGREEAIKQIKTRKSKKNVNSWQSW